MHAVIQTGVEEEVTLIKEAAAKSTSDRAQSLPLLAAMEVRVSAIVFNLALWQRLGFRTLILKPYMLYMGHMCRCLIGWLGGGLLPTPCRHIYQNPKHTDTKQ